MDLTIREVYCGNKNCIGVVGATYGNVPKAVIVIEDSWDVSVKVIEEALIGIISHETIEYLLLKLEPKLDCDLHGFIGHSQKIKDYFGNRDGIVLGKNAVIPH